MFKNSSFILLTQLNESETVTHSTPTYWDKHESIFRLNMQHEWVNTEVSLMAHVILIFQSYKLYTIMYVVFGGNEDLSVLKIVYRQNTVIQ